MKEGNYKIFKEYSKMKKTLLFIVVLILIVYCTRVQYETIYVDPAFNTKNISNIAILDFKNKTDFEVAGTYATSRLKYYLLKKSDFLIIEEDKIQKAIDELHFNMTWLSDPQKIKEIGEFIAADALIIGTVYGFDDPHAQSFYTKEFDSSFEITIRVLEVEGGRELYNNNCKGVHDEITIHSADPEFLKIQIARNIIDQCVDKLSSEFVPQKIKRPIKK